jgi:curved DNA-binding protein CbpA
MQEFEEDYYDILGVAETATLEEIRSAYIQLAKKLHPDRFPNEPEKRSWAQAEFAKVTRAHDVVSDEARRDEYNAFRKLIKDRQQQIITMQGADASSGAAATAAQAVVFTEETKSKWAEKHLLRADELFGRKIYHEAESALKEAIRLVPADTRFHNKLAEIYIARGWRTLAMTEIQTSIRLDPKNHEAKMLELKVKSMVTAAKPAQAKKGFFDQFKGMMGGK